MVIEIYKDSFHLGLQEKAMQSTEDNFLHTLQIWISFYILVMNHLGVLRHPPLNPPGRYYFRGRACF